jgi:hypothetical protein
LVEVFGCLDLAFFNPLGASHCSFLASRATSAPLAGAPAAEDARTRGDERDNQAAQELPKRVTGDEHCGSDSEWPLGLALRQTPGAAVRWRYMQRNPAIDVGRSPKPRREELLPFTRDEIDKIDVEVGPVFGPLVVFVAGTGLRTNEWTALERRDVDRSALAVVVQRRYADGVLTPYPRRPAAASR